MLSRMFLKPQQTQNPKRAPEPSEVRLICTIFVFANRCASKIGANVLLLGCYLLLSEHPKVLLVRPFMDRFLRLCCLLRLIDG